MKTMGVVALWGCCRAAWSFTPVSSRPRCRRLSASLQKGDRVQFQNSSGTVLENRGSGWYLVELAGNEPRKIRGSQLDLVIAPPIAIPGAGSESLTIDRPPVRIYNVDGDDRDRIDLEISQDQLDCFHSKTKWVAFSDLHCSPRTLDTCLQVLRAVHDTARAHDAGILFLGDFWHVRGSLRVDCLNAVLETLKGFSVPMIMLPGNHDQITYETSSSHGLLPLSNAYRIQYQNTSVPGVLIFSFPTIFQGALWIPHIRDQPTLRVVLDYATTDDKLGAIFCHVDVTGASMNDNVVSHGGISPTAFPKGLFIVSGHFHKPHNVTRNGRTVQYIGSPYQVSLSEAQQEKSLLVLESSRWSCVAKVTIDVGRKHFRVQTVSDLLHVDAGRGDRVVVDTHKPQLDDITFQDRVKHLRKMGSVVEIRELKTEQQPTRESLQPSPELTVESLWGEYLSCQVQRGAMSDSTRTMLLDAGLGILEEMEEGIEVSNNAHAVDLVFHSVTLQGFGPFREKTTYPLNNRGMVLLRGNNRDGGADSNGTGKTSLAMSIFWALTGSLDPRPMQDAKTTDVVNDDSKIARVAVSGTLNGAEFSVTRTKGQHNGDLVLVYDGHDLTTQSVKETQALLFELLGSADAQIIARTMFHSQHALNELLESTDARFKEHLALLAPLALWQQSVVHVRSKNRDATQRVSELNGMLSIRMEDQNRLQDRVGQAQKTFHDAEAGFIRTMEEIGPELESLQRISCSKQPAFESIDLEAELSQQECNIRQVESERKLAVTVRDKELEHCRHNLDSLFSERANHVDNTNLLESEKLNHALAHEVAKEKVAGLKATWNIDSTAGSLTFSPPDTCPTCGQSIAENKDGLLDSQLQANVESDIESLTAALQEAERRLRASTALAASASKKLEELDSTVETAKLELQNKQNRWGRVLQDFDAKLEEARSIHRARSSVYASQARRQEATTRLQWLESKIDAAKERMNQAQTVLTQEKSELKRMNALVNDIELERKEKTRVSSIMKELSEAFGQRGIQTFVLQSALAGLERASQVYLRQISDGAQRLELSLDSSDRIHRRSLLRGSDGTFKTRPMASLSGGQWRRCSLALNLAFADLLCQRGGFRSSLCVFDEPLTHLDQTGRSDVGSVLRKLLRRASEMEETPTSTQSFETIIVILQDLAAEELDEGFDCIDDVVKEGGVSSVFCESFAKLS